MNIFIIIAAYNESATIGAVIASLRQYGYTAVVVDDGSHDGTAHAARHAGAIVLQHPVNLGQGAALQTGFEYARAHGADVMITFDADGQYVAEDLPPMIEQMQRDGLDVVLGSRFLGKTVSMPPVRRLIIKAGILFTNATTGLKLTDTHNGVRALRVATTMGIALKHNRMAHASEILEQIAALKLRYGESPCVMLYTDYSMSKGQKNLNAIHILLELFLSRLSAW